MNHATTKRGPNRREPHDVMFCYKREDELAVVEIANRLERRGLRVWLDIEQCPPGRSWQKEIDRVLRTIPCAAVFFGNYSRFSFRQLEIEALIGELVERRCSVIPVILPGTRTTPRVPRIVRTRGWVDFRTKCPDPIDQMVWGITGEHPSAQGRSPLRRTSNEHA